MNAAMVDYHIHLENGPYKLDWLYQFWHTAKKRGLTEIGITEHCHKFKEFYPMFSYLAAEDGSYQYMHEWIKKDFQHSLEDYIDLLLRAREQGIQIKIGLEVDYLPNSSEFIHNIINQYPFDYILGSVHVIGKWGFDYAPRVWEGRDINQAYKDYYQVLAAAVNSELFDIIAHFDLIKVFGHRNTVSVESEVKNILQKMADKKLCLEISSAGIRKPINELYPAEWIIEYAAKLQVPITFASDAHYPEDVGFEWEKLVSCVKKYGYGKYTRFSQRQAFYDKIICV